MLLKVFQSVDDKRPLFVALAVGILNVWVSEALVIVKSVPVVDVANV